MDDSSVGFATGLLGTLDNGDCLVHILRSLSLGDYITLALASKRIAAFLVDGVVLRATWGARLGVDGRFDPQFGPHQFESEQDDPCVSLAVPRAWRRAAQVSAACANAAHLILALYKLNVPREKWDSEVEAGMVSSVDAISLNAVGAAQQDERQPSRRAGASWLYRWKTRWSAAAQARAPGALYALALMLVCLVRMRRMFTTIAHFETSLVDVAKRTIGADFCDVVHGSAPVCAGDGVPDADLTPEAMADNAMLSYWPDVQVIRNALACLSSHAMACVSTTHPIIARLLVKSVDLWKFGFGHPMSPEEATATVRSNLVVYNALRTREMDACAITEARDIAGAAMLHLVPRALRLDAQRLMIACSGIDNVLSGVRGFLDLSLTRGAHTTGRNLAARMTGATYQEALDMFAESVPYVRTLINGRSALVSPPASRRGQRRSSPHSESACSFMPADARVDGAALVAWVRLWSLSMGCDLAKAFANINLLNTRNAEPRQYPAGAFDASVLVDMIRAWRKGDNARLCEDVQANMIIHSARLAVLSWATVGGPLCMKQLCDLVDSNDDIAWLLSSDGCRDLAVSAASQASDAIKKLALARSHRSAVNIQSLYFACASTPSGPSDTYGHSGADDEAIASLRVVVGRLSSMADAFAWCLDTEGLIDQETAVRVRGLAVYVGTTRDHAASILGAASKTKAAA